MMPLAAAAAGTPAPAAACSPSAIPERANSLTLTLTLTRARVRRPGALVRTSGRRALLGVTALVSLVGVGCAGSPPRPAGAPAAEAGAASDAPPAAPPFRVLLFSRTVGFRHDAIPAALAALGGLQATTGFVADATEDPARFSPAELARYQVVVFALTTGDVLDDSQQAAFEAWALAGGGWVGIHSASDTEYGWPFYQRLVGASFASHPAVQRATVRVERTDHPATEGLPATWARTDEWYNFAANPRPRVTVLATVDEASYGGGTQGDDHPVSWSHEDGGRAFYTAMGHTAESYAEPLFLRHLAGALRWAARRAP